MNHLRNDEANIFILVVEDSLTQAEEIRYFLETSEYDVEVCHDGKEGLDWLLKTEKLPDVIVSDVMMPKMNGYELCKEIRGDERLKEIPVILLTSLSEPHDIIKSIEAGANKFLTKPFDHKRLPEVIDELYINTQRRNVEKMEMGIRLIFGGNDFLITADRVQILDLLLSSYEDSYYKNIELQKSRSALERLNAELEQKVQERTKELQQQEEQFRTLSEHTPHLIMRIDRDMNFSYVNKAVEDLFGVSRDELIGHPTSVLEKVDKNCQCTITTKNIFQTKQEIIKELEVQTSGMSKWFDSAFVPEYDENHGIEYVLAIFRDITEQKKAEEQLKEKDKIMMTQSRQAAMGDMIAMIAHQWRQPLSVVSMITNNLRVLVELEEEVTMDYLVETAEEINTQIQQLSQTIDDFRNYFKPDQDKDWITIADVIEKVMKLMQKSLENNNIILEINNRSKAQFLTYSNQLLQVFINIINNAKDILKEKKIAEAKISVDITDTEDLIKITICDNGGGIPEDIIHKLGEPYFTTKSQNGTGLGIYMSKTILSEHLNGSMSWENRDDGACFLITLPIDKNS